MENAFEGNAAAVFRTSISPVQITKRAEKEMRRNKLVGAGRQYAPTLYNVLMNSIDDGKLNGYYPTLAREVETYITGKAQEANLTLDGAPLVRFIVDANLRKGKFDIIAENVAAPIIGKLRDEEMRRYGILDEEPARVAAGYPSTSAPQAGAYQPVSRQAGGYVPDEYPSEYPLNDSAAPMAYDDGPFPVAAPNPFETRIPSQTNPSYPGGSPTTTDFTVPPLTKRDAVGAKLINTVDGRQYKLALPLTIVGRGSEAGIVIKDVNISRRHASFSFTDGRWNIKDLNSTNGTFVNNRRVSSETLHDGDVLTLGISKFEFLEG